MIRKNLMIALFMAFGMMSFFTSCDKDQIEELDTFDYVEEMGLRVPGDDTEEGKRGGKKRTHCFELVFPVTIEFSDGTTEEAVDAESLKEILKTWKENNPGPQSERPEFIYPIEVVLMKDGNTVTINSKEEMKVLVKTCKRPKKHKKFPFLMERLDSCYTVNYPINVVFPDGTAQVANDREELKTIFITWKENNPGHKAEYPKVEFPIEITKANGEVITVETMKDLWIHAKNCLPNRPGKKGKRGFFFLSERLEDCFTITYPLEVALPDGIVASGADREEVIAILKTWHENNQGTGNEKPKIIFPVEVTLEDGTVKSITDSEQMRELVKYCKI